jgi:hypothetical protein
VPGWVRVQRGEEGAGEQVRRRRHRWCAGGEGGGVCGERAKWKEVGGGGFLFVSRLVGLAWAALRGTCVNYVAVVDSLSDRNTESRSRQCQRKK